MISALRDAAQKLVEQDYSKDDSEETRGAKEVSWDIEGIPIMSACEIHCYNLGKTSKHGYTNRLARTLKGTLELIRKNPRHYFTDIEILYSALSQYPNGLMDLHLTGKTKVGDLFDAITTKTDWVVNELENLESIPRSRRRDLATFCCSLSRAIRNYSSFDGVRHLAA